MSPHACTEDQLVEQPAIGLFATRGWQTVSATDETFGAGSTLGREPMGEMVLVDRFRAVLTKLNPGVSAEAIQTAIDELAYQPRGGEMSPEQVRRDARRAELKASLDVLTSTDMAVIVLPGQNEIEQMKKLGIDIEPHRRRMNDSQPGLDENFKDTADPLRLIFVCAMWLT